MKITRREFIAGAAAGAAGGTLISRTPRASAAVQMGQGSRLPRPESSGIDHIVVVMMENRSFDHYLGWVPGADGRQGGLSYLDTAGVAHRTYHLQQPSGCGFIDPDHSYVGGRIELDHGLCDGWLRAASDLLAIGYYEAQDLDFYRRAAHDWTVCDHYFAAMLGPTFPNRLFLHAVSFIDPRFLGEENGTSNDDHPLADIRAGQYFLDTIYQALTTSPNWERSVLVINYDEWGGFFDHVVPPIGPDPRPDLGTDGTGQRGFRVPCLVISPMARRRVAHQTFDHTSILKMIEWRFGLAPLTIRDAAARNLAEVLDLAGPRRRHVRQYDVPNVATPGCPSTSMGIAAPGHAHFGENWLELRDHAAQYGFHV